MNREIKFRGMTVGGSWVYGNISVLKKRTGRVDAGCYISNPAGIPFAYEVRPDTVGQFTGLNDTYNIDAYEGDVFEHLLWPGIPKRYIIEWDSDFPGFCIRRLEDGHTVQLTSAWMRHSKIIGTRVDNLLGEE